MLSGCIRSIIAAPPKVPFEIVVIDNASTDDSMDRLSALGEIGAPPRTIRNRSNLGLARANNLGVAPKNAPFILALNPDTIVRPDAIDSLLEVMENDPETALAGPRLLSRDGSPQTSVLRSPPGLLAVLAEGFHFQRLIPQPYRGEWFLGRHWNHDRLRSVPMVFGAAMMIRRAAVDDVGGFDEGLELHVGDDEFCLRLRRHGWKILFAPNAEMVHFQRQSSRLRWSEVELNREIVRSRLRFFCRALSRPRFAALVIATLVVYALNLFLCRLLRRKTEGSYLEATVANCASVLRRFCCTGNWKPAQ